MVVVKTTKMKFSVSPNIPLQPLGNGRKVVADIYNLFRPGHLGPVRGAVRQGVGRGGGGIRPINPIMVKISLKTKKRGWRICGRKCRERFPKKTFQIQIHKETRAISKNTFPDIPNILAACSLLDGQLYDKSVRQQFGGDMCSGSQIIGWALWSEGLEEEEVVEERRIRFRVFFAVRGLDTLSWLTPPLCLAYVAWSPVKSDEAESPPGGGFLNYNPDVFGPGAQFSQSAKKPFQSGGASWVK